MDHFLSLCLNRLDRGHESNFDCVLSRDSNSCEFKSLSFRHSVSEHARSHPRFPNRLKNLDSCTERAGKTRSVKEEPHRTGDAGKLSVRGSPLNSKTGTRCAPIRVENAHPDSNNGINGRSYRWRLRCRPRRISEAAYATSSSATKRRPLFCRKPMYWDRRQWKSLARPDVLKRFI
jgi:hypothetical protein